MLRTTRLFGQEGSLINHFLLLVQPCYDLLKHVAFDLRLTHVNTALSVFLLAQLHQSLELDASVAPSLTRKHVRGCTNVLIVSLILVDHLSIKATKSRWSLSFEHHCVEVGGSFLFEDDAHGTLGLANDATSATSLDIGRLKEDTAAYRDSLHPHLLWITSTLDPGILKLL